MQNRGGRGLRRWAWRLLIIGTGLEVLFRVAGVCPTLGQRGLDRRSTECPELPFELTPGADVTYGGFCIRLKESRIHVSEQGLRDRVYPLERIPEWKRIAVVGDSIAFGFGVNDGESFPDQWEALLMEKGGRVEIINFSAPGYGLGEYVSVAECKASAFQPDEVWVFMIANDLRGGSFPFGGTGAGRILLVPAVASRVFRALMFGVMMSHEVFMEMVAPGPFHPPDLLDARFDRLSSLAERGGWKPVVVWMQEERRFAPRVGDAAHKRGIRFVDVGAFLAEDGPSGTDYLPDHHLSAQGHRRVAEFLAALEP